MTFPIASPLTDLQAGRPAAAIFLSRVGVVGARAGVMLADGSAQGQPSTISADITVGLSPDQRGVHMSRFHEVLGALTHSENGAVSPINLAQLAHDLARDAADR
ncbi:MAG: GTP cyclohydrolase I FolE2, partial [Thermoleophilia bacterium]|nr:GTP cyclohydrolase I FolE2 [Thermoleophilia bacterium]